MSLENNILTPHVWFEVIEMFRKNKTYTEMAQYCATQGFSKTPEQIRKSLSNRGIIAKYRNERNVNKTIDKYYTPNEVEVVNPEPDGGFIQRENNDVLVQICLKEDRVDKSITAIYHEGKVIDVLKHWIDRDGNLRNEYKSIAMELN
jgi:uncharacterized protein YaaQ